MNSCFSTSFGTHCGKRLALFQTVNPATPSLGSQRLDIQTNVRTSHHHSARAMLGTKLLLLMGFHGGKRGGSASNKEQKQQNQEQDKAGAHLVFLRKNTPSLCFILFNPTQEQKHTFPSFFVNPKRLPQTAASTAAPNGCLNGCLNGCPNGCLNGCLNGCPKRLPQRLLQTCCILLLRVILVAHGKQLTIYESE
jgi:hypothetical protein